MVKKIKCKCGIHNYEILEVNSVVYTVFRCKGCNKFKLINTITGEIQFSTYEASELPSFVRKKVELYGD